MGLAVERSTVPSGQRDARRLFRRVRTSTPPKWSCARLMGQRACWSINTSTPVRRPMLMADGGHAPDACDWAISLERVLDGASVSTLAVSIDNW